MQESCETFEYGGCAGNTNNFLSLDRCNGECLALKGESLEENEEIWKADEEGKDISKVSNPCSLPMDPGPCKGNNIR